MPLTDQEPPLTVVVAAVVVLVPSVMVTEIVSPLPPVPLAATLLTLALVMFGVVVKATVGATVILVSFCVMVVVLATASVSVAA